MKTAVLRLLALLLMSRTAPAGAQTVVTWGDGALGQSSVPAGLTGVVAIAAGNAHSLALRVDGTVASWGWDIHGQSTVPAGLTGVVAIAAGGTYSLALKADGTVASWGDNSQGQSSVPEGLTGVVAIAAGNYHALALKSDGTIAAWGANSYGQRTVPAGLTGVVAIAAGEYHSLALKADGTVTAWGRNNGGQTTVPAGLNGVVALSAGSYHSLALKANGTVVSWPQSGQSSLPGVVAIAAGYEHSLELNAQGTVASWGSNDFGKSTVPAGLTGLVAIAAGGSHSVAVTGPVTGVPVITSSRRWITEAAGARSAAPLFYQRIRATGAPVSYTAAGLPSGLLLNSATGVISGAATTVGTFNVSVTATNSEGTGSAVIQLTVTGLPGLLAPPPARVLDGDSVALMLVGTVTAAGLPPGAVMHPQTGLVTGLTRPGAYRVNLTISNAFGSVTVPWNFEVSPLRTWGNSEFGLGTIPMGLTGVAAIAAGYYHSLVLKTDGTVAAWGHNGAGRSTVPAGLIGVVAIAASNHSLALKADGTVASWGSNGAGQSTVPAGLTGVVAIAAGGTNSLALKADGTVTSWGDNSQGQSSVPAGLTGVVTIAAGIYHSMALKADGTVASWGSNAYGQRTVPAGLTGVVAIAAGTYHSLALKADGTVTAWGYNVDGRSTVPAGLTGVVAIAAGDRHSLALKADGTVSAWGYNFDGRSTVPAGLTRVVAISAGVAHSLVLGAITPVNLIFTAGQATGYTAKPRVSLAQFSAANLPPGLTIHPATGIITGTCEEEGTWLATITSSNARVSSTEKVNFTVLAFDAPYAVWDAAHWPTGGPAAGTSADSDHDNLTNHMEYALNTNPATANAVPGLIQNLTAGDRLVLEITAADRGAAMVWKAQFSDNLTFSAPVEAAPAVISGAPAGSVILRFTDPAASPGGRRFGRLVVTTP